MLDHEVHNLDRDCPEPVAGDVKRPQFRQFAYALRDRRELVLSQTEQA